MNAEFDWFASCPKGLESLLLEEVNQLGAAAPRETVGGCHFAGSLALGYRLALWSRLANRIHLRLSNFPCDDADQLYEGIKAVPWSDYMLESATFFVDFSGQNKSIRNTQFGAQRTKDGLVDFFRDRGAGRPNVSKDRPDVRINVRLRKGEVQVALDFGGSSLHERGYRSRQGAAPIKENLAAALLLRADWPGIAARGGALIDPMCGSGTILIEAAQMAAGIAPGLRRRRWGFEGLKIHNARQWQTILKEAESKAARAGDISLPEIRGYDADPRVLDRAQENIRDAGLEKHVRVSRKPVQELVKPTHKVLQPGLVISNPPYGERLGDLDGLRKLYESLGKTLLREFSGWQAAILTGEKELGLAIGIRAQRRYALFNGPIPVTLLLFDLEPEHQLSAPVHKREVRSVEDLSDGATMLFNRLRKNRKKWDSWARKRGIECYRVYDADLPEYAVAIDRYGEKLHVAEYVAPKTVREEDAERRIVEVQQVLPFAFDCPEEDIFFKRRQRQRGREQYQRQGNDRSIFEVSEGRVKLLVNLSDYLDTGLFLDHRPLRLEISQQASDKRFLNLFCYTASASVHAAAGGAASTTSVDMSNTYLDWARKNFRLNGHTGPEHHFERADVQQWLAACQQEYDLILLDPPSFSNSKRMESDFDVQRDHMDLLQAAMAVLSREGVLYFSNNLRSFKLSEEVSSRWQVLDISRSTLDDDFVRRPNIHRCWRLQHRP